MSDPDPIYLDYNATTPVAPGGGRGHAAVPRGALREPVEPARPRAADPRRRRRGAGEVAAALGARPDEIVFTSGGTEANNLAILGAARANRQRGARIVTSAFEHPAVGEPSATRSSRRASRVERVGVDASGAVDPDAVAARARAPAPRSSA